MLAYQVLFRFVIIHRPLQFLSRSKKEFRIGFHVSTWYSHFRYQRSNMSAFCRNFLPTVKATRWGGRGKPRKPSLKTLSASLFKQPDRLLQKQTRHSEHLIKRWNIGALNSIEIVVSHLIRLSVFCSVFLNALNLNEVQIIPFVLLFLFHYQHQGQARLMLYVSWPLPELLLAFLAFPVLFVVNNFHYKNLPCGGTQ